jgi:aspartate/methionine/tyrosine aminotransferase
VRRNYRHLLERSADMPSCDVLRAGGGWSAIVRVPSIGTEEDIVVSLLARDGVLTHPGYFFDFPAESYLVISLIVPETTFTEGVSRLLRHFDCTVAPP